MKPNHITICAAIALLHVPPALAADPYAKVELWTANTAALSAENLCASAQLGMDYGPARLAAQVMCHRHLGKTVLGVAPTLVVEPWRFGPITPYASVSAGPSTNGAMLTGGLGAEWRSLSIGFTKICYDIQCQSRDTVLSLGIRKDF